MRKFRTVFLLLILVMVSFFSFQLNLNLRDPKAQLQILAEFDPKPGDMVFQGPAGWVGYSTSGYVISLSTKNDSTFGSIEYVVITRANSKISVDLIKGSGPENSSILLEGEALSFLKRHSFDLSKFDMRFEQLNFQ